MKILLAEDTTDLNRVVTALLQHENYDVDSVFDGLEALEHIMNNGYDGVILDIMMPGMDGISVLKEMRAKKILTPVLLLTAKTEVDDRVTGLDAGADDYLPKPFAMKELLARIRAMMRRRLEYTSQSLTYADFRLDADTLALSAENTVQLSIKEYELLELLIEHADRELDTKFLLSEIWPTEEADQNTVWLYVRYLQRKLQAISSIAKIAGEKGKTVRLTGGHSA